MKVLVLEDEFQLLKGSFDYLNTRFYNGTLHVDNYAKTQDFPNIKGINDYDKIFVDISLHRASEQDGFSFLKSIRALVPNLKKIVIITGSDKVNQKLEEIGFSNIAVLPKPITFLDLKSVMPAYP